MSGAALLTFLRSLSFGGLLGAGVALALCVVFGQVEYTEYAIIYGGLLGAALHRIIDNLIIKGIFYPIGYFVAYYAKLIQIETLRRREIIDIKTCERIKRQLTLNYFTGELLNKDLPEAKSKTILLPNEKRDE